MGVYWPKWMMVNSAGRKSVSLTLLIIACFLVFLRFIFSGIVINVGTEMTIILSPVSLSGLALFISPFLALYFGRRLLGDKKEEADLQQQSWRTR